jgi:hypothetical protein
MVCHIPALDSEESAGAPEEISDDTSKVLGRYLYEAMCHSNPEPTDLPWDGLTGEESDVYVHIARALALKIESLRVCRSVDRL